jgi:hypothetical protein
MEKSMRHKGLLLAAVAMLALPALKPAPAQTITEVQYVEYPGYYAYEGYYGPRVLDIPGRVIGNTTAAVGGVLSGPYPYYGVTYYGETGVAACARRFRSFDPATGTYTAYTGEQIVCPYLGG